ncbi:biliverdin-producing heme oxygenase [Nocardioides limicola]|uniref:biliverdin-producing heme oxygenase n=1 Tax=Nocardioides limicola TaxID=2803368 RepID=UPI00193C7A6B|nr:biliverdin-producing heme oxygenase [Nocardioides sp. DJM-14]
MTALSAPEAPLSVAMRDGSAAEHDAAETSRFLAALLAGDVNEQGYADYLLRLRPVYAALEELALRLVDHPAVAAVADPALNRLAAIDADLAHWAPDAEPADSAASAAYVSRVLACEEWPPLFVAHHYTRYLGDLSGGQAIGRILDRSFGLGGAGLAFYDFPEIARPKPYKDRYRAALDALEVTPRARVVEEVQVAFRCNRAIFDELAAQLPRYAR